MRFDRYWGEAAKATAAVVQAAKPFDAGAFLAEIDAYRHTEIREAFEAGEARLVGDTQRLSKLRGAVKRLGVDRNEARKTRAKHGGRRNGVSLDFSKKVRW